MMWFFTYFTWRACVRQQFNTYMLFSPLLQIRWIFGFYANWLRLSLIFVRWYFLLESEKQSKRCFGFVLSFILSCSKMTKRRQAAQRPAGYELARWSGRSCRCELENCYSNSRLIFPNEVSAIFHSQLQPKAAEVLLFVPEVPDTC